MDITLNGQTRTVQSGITVEQLVALLELTGKAIAVAVNRRVVNAANWSNTVLAEHDNVDVVRAIGGG
jgi:sulfur carrier protein